MCLRCSHVLVEATGPAKVLCRFAPCTNPACQFRHEDANGNPIPPPASRKHAAASAMAVDESENGGEGSKSLDPSPVQSTFPKPLPGKPLNGTIPVPCRFAAGCLNPKCKFIHDNKRPCNFGIRCFKGSYWLSYSNILFLCADTFPVYSGLSIFAPAWSQTSRRVDQPGMGRATRCGKRGSVGG